MAGAASRVKAQLEAEGLAVTHWARRHGFNVRTVRAVIRGELKAKRGISHQIAVALGMKPKPTRRTAS